MDDTRESVRWFARQMEAKLKAHDSKHGWSDESIHWLVDRVDEELCELRRAIREAGTLGCMANRVEQQDRIRNVIAEAADVANFAMMVADISRRYLPDSRRELDDKPE